MSARAVLAVLTSAAIVGAGGGCAATSQKTTTGAAEDTTPAPSKADRRAANRAWRKFLTRQGRQLRKAYAKSLDCSGDCPGLTVSIDPDPVWWKDCASWDSGAFCAVGSIEIVDRTTPGFERNKISTIGGSVAQEGHRWVASED